MTRVHMVVPDGIDDPRRPSGGNVYDRRAIDGLHTLGWEVREVAVPGGWPEPDTAAREGLGAAIAAVPDGDLVVVDGLVASTAPDVLVPASSRVRLVPLVHLPLGEGLPAAHVRAREAAVLEAAAAVVATSRWTRHRLLDRYGLSPHAVHVAEPGVDPAEHLRGIPSGISLICVAAIAPHKGHDVLVDALTKLADLDWRLALVGSRTVDPPYVDRLVDHLRETGLDDRVRLTGPLVGRDLATAWSTSDLLVLASRGETFGMVVTEALSRGLPVVASHVGGLPHALGHAPDGKRPGLLVPPDDPGAMADALRRWLEDAELRDRLRAAAADRRTTLTGWDVTVRQIAAVLDDVPR
jgi:glycosyltransferase involved in cell wall biosynthesis